MYQNKYYLSAILLLGSLLVSLSVVNAQGGSGSWGNGAGSWSNANAGGAHNPATDPQYSYGYAGVDSRGPYGGAGGNGGYYVSGTDEHGRPFSYNGGAGVQPLPGQPGYTGRADYPGSYAYRGGATTATAAATTTALLALVATTLRAWL